MSQFASPEGSSPSSLDAKEHRFVHVLEPLRPIGINSGNPNLKKSRKIKITWLNPLFSKT